ncbi:TTN [Mytilus coruscus]|uniref:TTN n=1 Tax=Mytilus coruscus TaxID=42192 RepID=A0A6J8AEY8_MYTCO|nr:TTN [Mytilus coruscus]
MNYEIKVKQVNSPDFISPLQDIAAVHKSSVRLKCVLNVDATVEWFKDGLPLYTATKVHKKEHWYTIRNMSKADCGKYVCRCEAAVTSCYLTLKYGILEKQQAQLSYAELQSHLREARRAERDERAHVEILLKEKEDLQKKILELKKDSKTNKDGLENARSEISGLKTQIDSLKDRINRLETDIFNYETELKGRDQKIENDRKDFQNF